jgi:RNA polymerase sigma-70 factor (ECF subfamily)
VEAPEEFHWLFAREYPDIVWAANVILHDYPRAEEVAQDAFVKLLEHWSKVSRYDRPGAWVRQVAIRRAVKVARRESRLVSTDRAWPASEEGRPVDLDLMNAVRQLAPQQRAIVASYYLEDRPASEIAEIVGCSVSTVSVHLHRARRRLAELLGEGAESHVS